MKRIFNCEECGRLLKEGEDTMCDKCKGCDAMSEKENQWISVEEALPEKNVLATYINSCGYRRIVKAFYAKRYEMEGSCDNDDGVDEYCEEKDEYYVKEGWYELIDNWGDYSFVVIHEGKVDYWMPLPKAPDHLISKGEGNETL